MLFLGAHLAEGLVETVGQEHRIVTETERAARRPHQRAFGFAAIIFGLAVREGEADDGDEAAGALRRFGRADLLQRHFGALHGHAEIPAAVRRLGPVGSVDARRAVERVDAEA